MMSCEKDDEVTPQNNKSQEELKPDDKKIDDGSNGVEYVDLGLSVKWATQNLPDFYAWGELRTKSLYNTNSYKHYYRDLLNDELKVRKYCNDTYYGYADSLTTLVESDDAAHVILGGKWRIPTAAEWQELIDKCTWVPRDVNSYYCYYEVVVTGPNGNSITLRAEGEYQDRILFNTVGYYWSSEVDTVYPFRAKKLVFSRDTAFISVGNRNIGLNIRPVMD